MADYKIVYRVLQGKQQLRCVALPFGTHERAEQALTNLALNADFRGGQILLMSHYDEDLESEK